MWATVVMAILLSTFCLQDIFTTNVHARSEANLGGKRENDPKQAGERAKGELTIPSLWRAWIERERIEAKSKEPKDRARVGQKFIAFLLDSEKGSFQVIGTNKGVFVILDTKQGHLWLSSPDVDYRPVYKGQLYPDSIDENIDKQ